MRLGQLQGGHPGQQRPFVGVEMRPSLLEAHDRCFRVEAGGGNSPAGKRGLGTKDWAISRVSKLLQGLGVDGSGCLVVTGELDLDEYRSQGAGAEAIVPDGE
jgi:hypothetical protein